MAGSIRQEASEEPEQADRLSALPDDVLMLILDNIEMISDAVRTSILSRRWRHLTGLRSEIVLDVNDFQPERIGSKYTLEDLVRTNAFVVEATKSILAHKSQRAIRCLSLRFYLRDESIDIVRSVGDAMANRKVVSAVFKILPEVLDKYCTADDKLTYGRRFMTFIHAYPRAFAGLTELHMRSLRLGESDIPALLWTCKKLEFLSLLNCDAEFPSVLQIEHAQLVELGISSCGFEKVELKWLPRLTHLVIRHWLPTKDQYPLSFGYVPQLWVLHLINPGTTLHKTFKLSEFLSNAPVGELTLDFLCERIWIQPEAPKLLAPLFRNLLMLELCCVHEVFDLSWTMFFLEGSSTPSQGNQHTGTISVVWGHKCYASEEDEYKENEELWREIFQKSTEHLTWEARDGFKHYNLSRLTIKGFHVEEKLVGYIKYVVGAAVNLQLVSLLGSRPCVCCQFRPSTTYPETAEEQEHIRKQISDWRSSPITIEFDI